MKTQKLVLLINKLPFGTTFTRLLYRAALRVSVFLLNQEGVRAVYIRGSMGRGTYVPGLSDIDLEVVVDEMDEQKEARFHAIYNRRHAFLKKIIPALNVFVHTAADLTIAERVGWAYFLNPKEDWVLVAGTNVLSYRDQSQAQLLLGWLKTIFRRYLVYQKYYFTAEPNKRAHLKVNENLVLFAGRLQYFLANGRMALGSTSFRKLEGLLNDPLYSQLVRLCDQYEKRALGGFEKTVFFEDIIPVWFSFLKAALTKLNPQQLAQGNDWSGFEATEASVAPETKPAVRERLKPFLADLREKTQAFKIAAVLSSVPNRNYNHKIYVVVGDNTSQDEHQRLLQLLHQIVRDNKANFPAEYFSSFQAPLIVSEIQFKYMGLPEKSGLEPYYMKKHGEVLFNNLGHALPDMDTTVCAASFGSECMGHLRFIRRRRDLLAHSPLAFKTAYIDNLTGTLPALHLFLEKKRIVTTPGEALRDHTHLINDEYSRFLADFYKKFAGAAPEKVDYDQLIAHYRENLPVLKAQANAITRLYLKYFNLKSPS